MVLIEDADDVAQMAYTIFLVVVSVGMCGLPVGGFFLLLGS